MRAAEAAEKLGVSRNTLLRWFREGRVTEVPRDRRGWRVFGLEDLERIRAELGDGSAVRELDSKQQKMRGYLRRVPTFANLPEPVLSDLASCARFVGRLAGQTLFSPGDRSLGLSILVKGRVRVFRTSAQGREQTLAIVTPFQTLAEAVSFRSDSRHTSFASCVESSTVMILPKARVMQLIDSSPRLAMAFLREFSSRIDDLEQRLEDQALLSLEQRVARALLTADPGLELSNQELASLLGAARESVSRVLSRMENQGLIRRGKGRVELLDLESLREL